MYEDQLWELLKTDPAAMAAWEALAQAGGQVYVVGGAVRDVLSGGTPKDTDLMVTGLSADQIEAALTPLGRLDFTGKDFGVFRLRKGGNEVEVAMPRTETSTGSLHTQFEVQADPNIPVETDLQRRDFVSNAMAFDLGSGTLIDPYGGSQALTEGRLSLVNENALAEDPLRIVRALVSVAKHGLEPDEALLQSIKDNAPSIRNLPGERIQMELDKLLSGTQPERAFEIAFESGLIDYLLPELSSIVGFDQQNPHHDLDVGSHTLQVLKKMSQLSNDPDLRLAALFHDSGKPDSFWRDESAPEGGGGHFYKNVVKDKDGNHIETMGQDHDQVGAAYARAAMERLRYPTKRIDRVEKLVGMHMWKYFNTTKGARKFLQACGGDVKMVEDLFKIREADANGKSTEGMTDFDAQSLEECKRLMQQVHDEAAVVTVKDLALDGNDLKQLGYEGREIGDALRALLEHVVDDPGMNTRENLLNILEGNSTPKMTRVAGRGKKKKKWQQPPKKVKQDQAVEVDEWTPTPTYEVIQIEQPKYKWSFGHPDKPNDLWMWKVDPVAGRPHHIEMTGNKFYTFAQGRIYISDKTGELEILVWEDRGTETAREDAVQAVEDWCIVNLGRHSDFVTYETEGIDWWASGKDPTTNEINQHYYYDPDDSTKLEKDDENGAWVSVKDDYFDQEEEIELEAYKQELMSKPMHNFTIKEWEDYLDLFPEEADAEMTKFMKVAVKPHDEYWLRWLCFNDGRVVVGDTDSHMELAIETDGDWSNVESGGDIVSGEINMWNGEPLEDKSLRKEIAKQVNLRFRLPKPVADGFSLKMEYSQDYKYSYDGNELDVWEVNQNTGDPHHFERIGPGHEQNAEGRIYSYGPNDTLHMVWTERGTPQLRKRARPLVEQWAKKNGTPITHTGAEEDLGLDKEGNILDPIQTELDQRVFNEDNPSPSIVKFITGLYKRAFEEATGLPYEGYVELALTGSLTTYQWSDTSDADVSIFPDYHLMYSQGLNALDVKKALVLMSIEKLDGTFLPGGSHPLQFFVQPPGSHPEMMFTEGIRSGYHLDEKRWINPPEKERVHDVSVEFPEFYKRAIDMGDKMTTMLDAGEYEAATEFFHQIHLKRQLDQRAGLGDFSEGNIVYKWLVHEGILDRLRNEVGLQISTKVALSESPMDKVTVKVIYNFEQDRIFLGTQADQKNMPASVIVGDYDDSVGEVILEPHEREWMNANYFRRLWAYSFPQRPLTAVNFRMTNGDTHQVPTKIPLVHSGWIVEADYHYETAFVYIGAPYNELLKGGSEHSDLMMSWMSNMEPSGNEPDLEDFESEDDYWTAYYEWKDAEDPMDKLEEIPMIFGHVGYGGGYDDYDDPYDEGWIPFDESEWEYNYEYDNPKPDPEDYGLVLVKDQYGYPSYTTIAGHGFYKVADQLGLPLEYQEAQPFDVNKALEDDAYRKKNPYPGLYNLPTNQDFARENRIKAYEDACTEWAKLFEVARDQAEEEWPEEPDRGEYHDAKYVYAIYSDFLGGKEPDRKLQADLERHLEDSYPGIEEYTGYDGSWFGGGAWEGGG